MVPFSAIQAAADQIAERFKPERIILFGSYAYGKPNEDSDVDYMVLVRSRNVDVQEDNIRMGTKFGFPVDLLVRSITQFEKRISMGDFFLMDIKEKGKVLYEAPHEGVGRKSGGRLRNRKAGTAGKKIT